jgi:hypothetical protein
VWWIVSAATPVLYIRLSYMQSLSVEFIREWFKWQCSSRGNGSCMLCSGTTSILLITC